ncbi:MAG: Ig-like domain-containing protein [Actinomycetota bacterium]
MKRFSIIATALVLGAGIGVIPASAATQPATPAVHLEDGGDGLIGLADASAVLITGTWDATDPDITDIVVDVAASPAGDPVDCAGPSGVTEVLHATPYPDGTFEAGPFDLTSLPDDSLLCARATAVWNDSTLSDVGLSDNNPILNISLDPGTVVFTDADGLMNAAETATAGAIQAEYESSDPFVVSAAVQFLDADSALADPSCDLGGGLAATDTVALPLACAGALPQGPFTVEVIWTDNTGNTASATDSMIKDTISVAPVITSPLSGKQVRPAPFGVTGTAEPGASVKVFEIRFSGDQERVVAGTATVDSSGAWTATISGLPLGDTHLRAEATDVAGNVSALSNTVVVRVDATVPYIITPAQDSLKSRYFLVSGVGRPGDQVSLYEGTTQLAQTGVHPDGSWSTQIARPTGEHTIYARGVRGGVLTDASETRTFRVDGDLPSVSISSPTGEQVLLPGNAATLQGAATDAAGLGAGVARVRVIYTDGIRGNTIGSEIATCTPATGGPAACGSGATSVAWKANQLPTGPALVVASVFAEDVAGNVSLVKTIRYTRL